MMWRLLLAVVLQANATAAGMLGTTRKTLTSELSALPPEAWLLPPQALQACGEGFVTVFAQGDAARGDIVRGTCKPCAPGKYQPQALDVTMSATCKVCPSGWWSPKRGSAACTKLLPRAGYPPGAGGTLLFPTTGGFCPPGKYGRKGLATVGGCRLCPAGRYGTGGDATSACSGPCRAGRYGLGGSLSPRCTAACAAGRFCGEGATGPYGGGPCPAGRFAFGSMGLCVLHAPAEFRPANGYTRPESEMGACILDKAYRIVELVLAVKECGGAAAKTAVAKDRNKHGRRGRGGSKRMRGSRPSMESLEPYNPMPLRGKSRRKVEARAKTKADAAPPLVAAAPYGTSDASTDARSLHGSLCDPAQADHLRSELEACCEGVEHVVLAKKRQACRRHVALAASALYERKGDLTFSVKPRAQHGSVNGQGVRGGGVGRETRAAEFGDMQEMLRGEWRVRQERAGRLHRLLAANGGAAAGWNVRWQYEKKNVERILMPLFRQIMAASVAMYTRKVSTVKSTERDLVDLTFASRQLLRACDLRAEPHADCSSAASVLAYTQRYDCEEVGCDRAEVRTHYGVGYLSAAPSPQPTPSPTRAPTPPTPAPKSCSAGRYALAKAGNKGGRGSRNNGAEPATCAPCPPAQYQDKPSPIIWDTHGLARSGSCKRCSPGHFSKKPALPRLCELCPPGKYSAAGFAFCLPCDPGTATDADVVHYLLGTPPSYGATTCTRCAAGYFQPFPAQPHCRACPIGKYRERPATHKEAQSCLPCPHGATSGKGAAACVDSALFCCSGASSLCRSCRSRAKKLVALGIPQGSKQLEKLIRGGGQSHTKELQVPALARSASAPTTRSEDSRVGPVTKLPFSALAHARLLDLKEAKAQWRAPHESDHVDPRCDGKGRHKCEASARCVWKADAFTHVEKCENW